MAGLAAAVLASACLDFAAPEPQAARTSNLYLLITTGDASPAALNLSGGFVPGIDTDGVSVTLAREEIVVGGVLVPPSERGPNEFRYEATWETWPGDVHGSDMPVEGVILAGSPSAHQLRLPLAFRDGPDSLALAPGEDLLLPLRLPSEPSVAEAAFIRWRLQVSEHGDDGALHPILTLDRDAPPEETIVVPGEWLGGSDRPLQVRLILDAATAREPSEAPYRMSGSIRVDLHWDVSRTADPPAS